MGSLTDQLAVLEQQARAEVCGVADLERLHEVKVKFLGRKGLLTAVLQQLGAISAAERPVVGKRANEIKVFLETELKHREDNLVASIVDRKRTSLLDVTLPGRSEPPGHIHPVTQILEEIKSIFWGLGFSIHEGPEVETDYYNFEALNIPQEHPARDMQDTFYIAEWKRQSAIADSQSAISSLLLRTHTSPVQIRVMEKQKPPIRIIAPGAVFRRDADVTHSPMFHQVEGLYVDRKVSMADLKGVLTIFVRALFGDSCPVRFRPSFFPFTEPSAEVDIGCVICGGSGGGSKAASSHSNCRVCRGTGWLEILGSGMVHPAVFEHVGYDPKKVSGFAFGLGVERVAMLKFGIDDIRLLYSGDLRFLEQF